MRLGEPIIWLLLKPGGRPDPRTCLVTTITPDDNLETASELLEESNLSYLPVVLPAENKKVVAILKQEDLLTTYKQRLLKVRLSQRRDSTKKGT